MLQEEVLEMHDLRRGELKRSALMDAADSWVRQGEGSQTN